MKYIQPIGETTNSGYSNGNATDGTLGSIIPAQAIEHPMREIVNVISKSGLTPSADDNTQLWQALRRALQPTGLIEIWSGEITEIPAGWLYCQGQEVSRTEFADLYALIGDKYGTPNDATKFKMPDMTQRTVMGRRFNTNDWDVGDTGGSFSKTVNTAGTAITEAQMPSHHHALAKDTYTTTTDLTTANQRLARRGLSEAGYNQYTLSVGSSSDADVGVTGNKGGGAEHNHSVTVDVTPPYIAMIYIIKT